MVAWAGGDAELAGLAAGVGVGVSWWRLPVAALDELDLPADPVPLDFVCPGEDWLTLRPGPDPVACTPLLGLETGVAAGGRITPPDQGAPGAAPGPPRTPSPPAPRPWTAVPGRPTPRP